MTADDAPTPDAPAPGGPPSGAPPPPPTSIANSLATAASVIAVGTALGFLLAYAAALLVVKVGLPVPRLVVGLPLVVVGALAWATTGGQTLRGGAITTLAAGAIAAALLVGWAPPSPATLFSTRSEVTDVRVGGDRADLTLSSRREMAALPPLGATIGYAALLASLAVVVTTVGHGLAALRKRSARPF